MVKSKLFSLDFFRDFQDKENFFEKLTSNEHTFDKILNQYLLLNVCSFIYGVVMGSYNGFLQAISSGVKVPLLFSLALLVCFPAFFIIQHILPVQRMFIAARLFLVPGSVSGKCSR